MANTTTTVNLNWTQSPSTLPAGRTIWIGDCQEGYWASLPNGMTEQEAIDDFVRAYDFAEEHEGTREELERELRSDLSVRIEEAHEDQSPHAIRVRQWKADQASEGRSPHELPADDLAGRETWYRAGEGDDDCPLCGGKRHGEIV